MIPLYCVMIFTPNKPIIFIHILHNYTHQTWPDWQSLLAILIIIFLFCFFFCAVLLLFLLPLPPFLCAYKSPPLSYYADVGDWSVDLLTAAKSDISFLYFKFCCTSNCKNKYMICFPHQIPCEPRDYRPFEVKNLIGSRFQCQDYISIFTLKLNKNIP